MKSTAPQGFEHQRIEIGNVSLSAHSGGSGAPLLFLHGYPQTHATFAKVIPEFMQHFRCILVDLPGYGLSTVKDPLPEGVSFSKRAMAQNIVEMMRQLGHGKFSVLGHDRGARVAYRMALDHPEVITRIGIIEIVPTSDMWNAFNAEMALKAYHWTFLAQPYPMPENMINADPVTYCDWTLKSWTQEKSLDAFAPDVLESYRKMFRNPDCVHAMCEDYRAGATIDRQLDEADQAAGNKIRAPLHFVWSTHGFPASTGDPIGIWRNWADTVTGNDIIAGHFAQEENPQGVIDSFVPFFRD